MDWIRSTDKFPPIEEKILLAIKMFRWDFKISRIRRPYDINKKFNESYYEFFSPDSEKWEETPKEFFWMKLEAPQKE